MKKFFFLLAIFLAYMGKCNFVYAEETEESTSNVNLEIICPEVILVGG